MNTHVSSGNIFSDDLWVGSDSVFLDSFCVNKGSVRWWIHASALDTFLVTISESPATEFSLTISKSTGAVCAEESMRHLWKQFRGLFVSGQQLSFPWLFVSQQVLCGLTNPFVTCESTFEGYFYVGQRLSFPGLFLCQRVLCADESMRQLWKHFKWWFLSRQRLDFPRLFLCEQGQCELMNPRISSGYIFGDDFWESSDWVLLDCF
jgi:hypothetical protein